MTNEERDVIENFFSRLSNPQASGGQTAVAPIDQQANSLIAQECQKNPQAQYRMTQLAIVQEAGLVQAQNQIRQLQMQVQQLQQQVQSLQQSKGGFFSNLFGGNRSNRPTTPPPGYGAGGAQYQAQNLPYGMRPSTFRGGSGFLGSALSTATGVAGGVLAANALTSMFSGHHGAMGGMDPSSAGFPGADSGGSFLGGSAAGAGADPGTSTGGVSDPFDGSGEDVDSGFDVDDGDDDWGGGGFDDGGGFDGF